ncbi:hypothetical protein LINPERPRIM_LOCUS21519 [Linum perenne]
MYKSDTSMNTKLLRLPPRRNLASNKRKERDDPSDSYKSAYPAPPPQPPLATVKPVGKPVTGLFGSDKLGEPTGSNNQILAGYLAHEFLMKGTLFGQPWDPKENPTVASVTLEAKKLKPSPRGEVAEPMVKSEPRIEDKEKMRERYVEVSKLLKTKGAHLPGIVNPTQLARLLQM